MFILFYILIINFFIYKINVFNSKNKIIFSEDLFKMLGQLPNVRSLGRHELRTSFKVCPNR